MPALELAPTPPANALLSAAQLTASESYYPLRLCWCADCHHAQLIDVVDPEILFGDYRYRSGISPVFVEHLAAMSGELIRSSPEEHPFVVEIGSNDGTLLDLFKRRGANVLGVEPSKRMADFANEKSLSTLNAFFGSECAAAIRDTHGPADLICANNVLAHIDDLRDVFLGIQSLLSENGQVVFEVSYLVDVIEQGLFDTIYHEHLSYHSVGPMKQFLESVGLELIAVKRVKTQGGSIRFYAQSTAANGVIERSVEELMRHESSLGLASLQPFESLSERISSAGTALRERIDHYKKANKSIAGFGAPAKLTTLMHEFGLTGDDIAFVVEENKFKEGLYTPGTHIPIRPTEDLDKHGADVVVVFAWNFAQNIISRCRHLVDRGVTFLIPLPELTEVDHHNIDEFLT